MDGVRNAHRLAIARHDGEDSGARHEDAALEGYAERVGCPVYGEQKRVNVAMPLSGPAEALAHTFPRPPSAAPQREAPGAGPAGNSAVPTEEPLFRLTGFVDGIADVPRLQETGADRCVGPGGRGQRVGPAEALAALADEPLIVEVKHRMGSIKDPPETYDRVQLCSYCRALGCSRGDLVQCLREGGRPRLHITRFAQIGPPCSKSSML